MSTTAALTPIYASATIPRTFSVVLATPTMSWTPTTAIELLDSPHLPGVLPSTTSDGTVTYAVVGGTSDCAVTASTGELTFTTLGTCQVTGSTNVTSRYAAGSVAATFVVGRVVRPITLLATPSSITAGGTSRLSTIGILSAGAVNYSITSGAGCSLSGSDLTSSTPGTCVVRVDVAEDDTYAAATANATVTVTAAGASPRPPGPIDPPAPPKPGPPPGPVDPGEPLPRTLDPILDAAGTAPGLVLVSVGGEEVSVRVVPHDDRHGVEIISDEWSIDVVSLGPAGEPVALKPDGTLTVTPGGVLAISGRGFESTAQVRTYLLSGPTTLGALMTDRSGGFEGSLPVSRTLTPGADALQINGFTPDREVRSVTIGIGVLPPAKQREARTKVKFAANSARLTRTAKKQLKSMMALLAPREHLHTTITGAYFARDGERSRALAQARSAKVNRYLGRLGLQGAVSVSIKPVRVTDYSKGRRVVVRTYYTVSGSRS